MEQIPWGKIPFPSGPWNLLPNRSGDIILVTGSPKYPFFLKLRAHGRSVSKRLRYHGGLKLDLFKAFSLWRYSNCSRIRQEVLLLERSQCYQEKTHQRPSSREGNCE